MISFFLHAKGGQPMPKYDTFTTSLGMQSFMDSKLNMSIIINMYNHYYRNFNYHFDHQQSSVEI